MTAAVLASTACSSATSAAVQNGNEHAGDPEAAAGVDNNEKPDSMGSVNPVHSAVDFNRKLDSYEPLKDHYNFYFTYKTVHPWWDAVALGMEEAQRQYLDKGIVITYEYMAPNGASANDQTKKLLAASQKDYDVIGVDVADEKVISPLLDEMVDS